MAALRIENWFQGPTGVGQGGWTSQRFAALIGEPVTVAIRRPIPLDVVLQVARIDAGKWHLVEATAPASPVLIATAWEADCAATEPVALADAAEAGTRFPCTGDTHPVPRCFSCGLGDDSMGVHAGPLGDGRWATTWVTPSWATTDDDTVDPGVVWAAIDCTQAWFAGWSDGHVPSVTAQIAVEIIEPLSPGRYALVAWAGDYAPRWQGRKRGAAGAIFDETGRCVARSRTFWVAQPDLAPRADRRGVDPKS